MQFKWLFMKYEMAKRPYVLGLAILVTLLVTLNGCYFVWSQSPTFWDDSYYLTGSLVLYDALADKGLPGFAVAFAHLYGNRAPLISIFPVPLYLAVGRTYDPRFLVGAAFVILMSIYLFRLGEGLWSPMEGLLAVGILQTMPLAYGLSRQFLVDYGLATLVVMWMYYLLCFRPLTGFGGIVRLGTLLGAGALMKVTFPLYIAAPTTLVMIAFLKKAEGWRAALRVVRSLGCVLAIGAMIAATWYLFNFESISNYALSAGYGSIAVHYGSNNLLSRDALVPYFTVLIVCALSSYYSVLVPALVPFWIASKRADRTHQPFALLLWVMIPLAATMFAVNKDPRFTAPILPAVGLSLARLIRCALDRLPPATAFVLMIVPVFAYGCASLPAHWQIAEFRLRGLVFWSPRLAWYAMAPGSYGAWGQSEVVEALCRDAEHATGHARVLIPLAHQYLNNVNIAYLSYRMRCDLEVIGLPPELRTREEVANWIAAIHPWYVLTVPEVPDPELAPAFANVMKKEAEEIGSRPGSGFSVFLRRTLGASGKECVIYRRTGGEERLRRR